MKKIIMGVMVLFFMLVITLVPLSAKAEMQAMTENEMEMVTAQITGSQLLSGLITGMQSGLNYLGVSNSQFTTFLTKVYTSKLVSSLMNSKLMVALNPYLAQLLDAEIPFTPKIK
ncbi:hypothetical protein ASZ90_007384 [hydrocarbon metagenome]|uniref:Uncharacterized protein n=1 Tax=hydrocarbon metagenome TaxID=938273 RepID=A0A0W8FR97_9ZZZZ